MILKKAEPAPVFNAFDKDTFKKNVIANIKTLYRKTLEEARIPRWFIICPWSF